MTAENSKHYQLGGGGWGVFLIVFLSTAAFNVSATAPGDYQILVSWRAPDFLYPEGTASPGAPGRTPGSGTWYVMKRATQTHVHDAPMADRTHRTGTVSLSSRNDVTAALTYRLTNVK